MANQIVVEKGTHKKKLQDQLKSLRARKKFPASKFCGKIEIKGDPLEVQKKLRDEWR